MDTANSARHRGSADSERTDQGELSEQRGERRRWRSIAKTIAAVIAAIVLTPIALVVAYLGLTFVGEAFGSWSYDRQHARYEQAFAALVQEQASIEQVRQTTRALTGADPRSSDRRLPLPNCRGDCPTLQAYHLDLDINKSDWTHVCSDSVAVFYFDDANQLESTRTRHHSGVLSTPSQLTLAAQQRLWARRCADITLWPSTRPGQREPPTESRPPFQ